MTRNVHPSIVEMDAYARRRSSASLSHTWPAIIGSPVHTADLRRDEAQSCHSACVAGRHTDAIPQALVAIDALAQVSQYDDKIDIRRNPQSLPSMSMRAK